MSTITIPLSEAKQKLSELIDQADKRFDRFVITKHGAERAIMLSLEDFEEIIETLDVLSDKAETQSILEGLTEIRERKDIPFEEWYKTRKSQRQ